MRLRVDGWWLATLAAVVAGVCFAVALWGATGHFDRSARRSGAVAAGGAVTASSIAAPIPTAAPEPTGYPDGTCLGVASPDRAANELGKVSCDEPHLAEVTSTVDLDEVTEAYPSTEAWDVINQTCVGVAEQYLGATIGLDREPKVLAAVLRIPETAWVGGARSTSCVLVEVDGAGNAIPRTGRLRA